MNIYVATSWRNEYHPVVVNELRQAGNNVYDFRNPIGDEKGFHWQEIDQNWESWSTKEYIESLSHPIAALGFKHDFDAMKWADAFVLILPSGRSAHLELGWAVGTEKTTCIYSPERMEPELMAKMCDFISDDLSQIIKFLAGRPLPSLQHRLIM